jgi:hypothetical protein
MSKPLTTEQRRAARKEANARAAATQRAIDIEAIDAFEIEHGDANIAITEIAYEPGLPVLAATRRASGAELKRYQARIANEPKATSAAAAEVGLSCILYPPEGEQRDALLEARPALTVGLGVLALGLAAGRAVEEAKS